MITVSVLYPRSADAPFNHDYYLSTHIPLVRSLWGPMGLLGIDLMRAEATLDGSACPFELIGLLRFSSSDVLQTALAAHGSDILADIPNFTALPPLIQINEPIQG